jgi:hypothetical protein
LGEAVKIAAAANERASEADARAAEANEKAETEKLERVKIVEMMLAQLKPRALSHDQREALVSALRGRLKTFTIFVDPNPDEETHQYALAIQAALGEAGAKVPMYTLTGVFAGVPTPLSGTMLFCRQGQDDSDEALGLIQHSFRTILRVAGVAMSADSKVDQYELLPSPSLIVKPKPPPFFWVWDNAIVPRTGPPAGYSGDWPPRPPWETV